MLVDQSRINAFAPCTGDLQWMHVDENRCRSESPYGKPVAHGFPSLSLPAGHLRRLVTATAELEAERLGAALLTTEIVVLMFRCRRTLNRSARRLDVPFFNGTMPG